MGVNALALYLVLLSVFFLLRLLSKWFYRFLLLFVYPISLSLSLSLALTPPPAYAYAIGPSQTDPKLPRATILEA